MVTLGTWHMDPALQPLGGDHAGRGRQRVHRGRRRALQLDRADTPSVGRPERRLLCTRAVAVHGVAVLQWQVLADERRGRVAGVHQHPPCGRVEHQLVPPAARWHRQLRPFPPPPPPEPPTSPPPPVNPPPPPPRRRRRPRQRTTTAALQLLLLWQRGWLYTGAMGAQRRQPADWHDADALYSQADAGEVCRWWPHPRDEATIRTR